MPIDLSLSTHPKSSITRHTVKILGVICNNLVKLLGGCLHRRKNVEAGGHGAHSMRRFQEYLDEEQKTYRLGELMSSRERERPVPLPLLIRQGKSVLLILRACFSCVHCRAHLASQVNLISKSFQGSQGRAYLFDSVVNIGSGPAEQRVLLTGLHHVADIFCQR